MAGPSYVSPREEIGTVLTAAAVVVVTVFVVEAAAECTAASRSTEMAAGGAKTEANKPAPSKMQTAAT